MKRAGKPNTYWSQVILLLLFMVFIYPIALLGLVFTDGEVLSIRGFIRDVTKPDMGSVLIRLLTWLILPFPLVWLAAIVFYWPTGSRKKADD
jgi:hypothetical protein